MLFLLALVGAAHALPPPANATGVSTPCAPTDNPDDCAALVALWNSTGRVLPWADGSSVCTWKAKVPGQWATGVTCDDSTKRVTQVLLNNNNLTGSIPPEVGQLSSLHQLWLDDNGLTGLVPTQLCPLIPGLGINCDLSGNPLQCPLPECVTSHVRCPSA